VYMQKFKFKVLPIWEILWLTIRLL
jgi:hypothetical protein